MLKKILLCSSDRNNTYSFILFYLFSLKHDFFSSKATPIDVESSHNEEKRLPKSENKKNV